MRIRWTMATMALCFIATGCTMPGQGPTRHMIAAGENPNGKFSINVNEIGLGIEGKDGKQAIDIVFDENPDSAENIRGDASGLPRVIQKVSRVQYDCRNHTAATLSTSDTLANHVGGGDEDVDKRPFQIIPSTDPVDEKIINFICLPGWHRWLKTTTSDSL